MMCQSVFKTFLVDRCSIEKALILFCRFAGGGIGTLGSRFVHKITSV